MSDSIRSGASKQVRPRTTKPFRVLLVDQDNRSCLKIPQSVTDMPVKLVCATSVEEARARLLQGPVDLVLVEAELPDGSGIGLAKQLRKGRSAAPQTILMTSKPSIEQTIEALRSGAGDILVKPLRTKEVHERILQAAARWKNDQQTKQRIRRLRRSCKQLNLAREEISKQVDVLCNDLVTAYQELANQLHQAVQSSEYAGLVRDELDLEALLHRTLEYLLEKCGPTNAAIFLPANEDEFSLAGYVNLDCTEDAAELIWQHLADVVAPKIAQHHGVLHLTDAKAVTDWLEKGCYYLEERHMVAYACTHEEEILAVAVLFRDAESPYSPTAIETCTSIAPILGQHLAKVVRVHHRLASEIDDSNDVVA